MESNILWRIKISESKLVSHTQRKFTFDLMGRKYPSRITIRHFLHNFKEIRCVTIANKRHSCRPGHGRGQQEHPSTLSL